MAERMMLFCAWNMAGLVEAAQILHSGHWNCTKQCLEDLVQLYRRDNGYCCACKQQMSAIAGEEESLTCLCRTDATPPSTSSNKMFPALCAFRLA